MDWQTKSKMNYMTKERLLAPRYKVIANFPGSQLYLNQIIELHYNINSVVEGQIKFYDQYPHLFQKLKWWEERKLEDMPDYVSYISMTTGGRKYFKCIEWEVMSKWYSPKGLHYLPESGYWNGVCSTLEPATEEEYNEYINQQP